MHIQLWTGMARGKCVQNDITSSFREFIHNYFHDSYSYNVTRDASQTSIRRMGRSFHKICSRRVSSYMRTEKTTRSRVRNIIEWVLANYHRTLARFGTERAWLSRRKFGSDESAILHAHALRASYMQLFLSWCGPDGSTLSKSNATMYYTTTICNVKTSCIGTIVCLSFICFRCLIVVDYFRFVFWFFRWREPEHSAVCARREKIETNGTYFNRFNGLPHMHHDSQCNENATQQKTSFVPAMQGPIQMQSERKLNGLSFE